MANSSDREPDARASDQEAADWIARRDRALTAAEQDDYLQWLRENPRHAAMITRHETTVRRLQRLAQWQPASSSEPNPDLFARPRRRFWRAAPALLAVAAALVAGVFVLRPRPEPLPAPVSAPIVKSFLRVNERQTLADGTIVELRDGSRIEALFTETERRVRLAGGEAHFTVAKNPAWPFVVEADKVVVRAVGTAFAVRLDEALVDVVVTEGKVRLERSGLPAQAAVQPAFEPPTVAASHRAVISLAPAAPPPEVVAVTAEEMKDALGWQAPRFHFDETPLAEAVAEFNRHNRQQLEIGEAALERAPIGGIFRVDNVDGFVSLLELTLGITAETRGDGTRVLKRAR